MSGGGRGVGTLSPSRPSPSPGGVARAARWPASAHPLPTVRTGLAGSGHLGAGDPLSSSVTGAGLSAPAESVHSFRRGALEAWALGTDQELLSTWCVGHC